MDYGVWGVMLLVCLLSLGLYGYKQMRSGTGGATACSLDTIRINGKPVEFTATCYLDRITPFAVPLDAAATVVWDFKDGSKPERGPVVSHKFLQEGTYVVTATVNGGCVLKANVEVVYNPVLSGNQAKPVIEIYADPTHPVIGSTVKFYCVTDVPSVASYEWKILNTNEVKQDAVPSFEFQREENYTVQLMINGDPSSVRTEVIKVTAGVPQIPRTADNSGSGTGAPSAIGPLGNLVPPGANAANTRNDPPVNNGPGNNNPGPLKSDTPKVSPSKAPEVDPAAFKDLLQAVVDQNGKEPEDLYEYLDYKASTKVEMNESGSLIPLKEFCRTMREKKKNKRKIEALSFTRDDKKSIQTIRVKVAKGGGLWDKLNPFN